MSSINSRYTSPLDLLTQSKLAEAHKKSGKNASALSKAQQNPLSLADKASPSSKSKHKPQPDGFTLDPSKGFNPGTNAGKRAGAAAQGTNPDGFTLDPTRGFNAGTNAGGRTGAAAQGTNPDGFTLDPTKGFNPGTNGGQQTAASPTIDNPDGFTLDPTKGFHPGTNAGKRAGAAAQGTNPDGITLDPGKGFNPGVSVEDDDARKAAQGLVSTTFIEPILKQARESNDAPPPFGPSRVEKQFGALLDTSLAEEIVQASDFPLVDRIAADLSKHGKHAAPDASASPDTPESRPELDIKA